MYQRPRQPDTVITVALNEAIRDLRQIPGFQRESVTRSLPQANATNDEALALAMHQLIQYPEMYFVAILKKAVPGILDMAFTTPPVSHLEINIHDTNTGAGRGCTVRCTAGVRVRHVVAVVSKNWGDSWVKELWTSGVEYTVGDMKTFVVSKEMMDLAARKGTVRHPGRRLRQRNYEDTDGEKVQIPESDRDSEDSDM
ncbi:hypothetical protein CB0940_05837 [Cercospora beticola]|uniref:Uncharacterized protein n=1 Tax=Cercospora beticola TaxID=122368 RepID=A0A2G5HXU8_CERBT|nr:hypothetical protein CB0940_05837 [Cercospora beticola]PIA97103.1 hypothetical protein CB0940_05837 [Cercospora beticola]WPA98428.1 hypothetical protein RHO25_003040 [Cercospora beticola]CAK1359676.1 unnamed protein product [Cercospora beticola]